QPFHTIRVRLTLARGSTTTLTPWVPVGKLRWTPQPHLLVGWSFTVDGTRAYGNLEPADIEAALLAVADAGVGLFSHRPDDPSGDRTVRIKEMRDLSYAGA